MTKQICYAIVDEDGIPLTFGSTTTDAWKNALSCFGYKDIEDLISEGYKLVEGEWNRKYD